MTKKRKAKNHFPRGFLMAGHKRKPPKPRHEKLLLDTLGANVVQLGLTVKEKETINTMIDFFRASGEQEHLDPEVYEAIAEKLGNGREPTSESLIADLRKLEAGLWDLGLETVGDEGGEHKRILADSAQKDLHELAKRCLSTAILLGRDES